MKFKVGDEVVIRTGLWKGHTGIVTATYADGYYQVQPSGSDSRYMFQYTNIEPRSAESSGQAGGLKFDAGKLVWDLLLNAVGMINALEGVVRVLMFGAKKYKAHSWREVEDAERRYLDGLMRHYIAIKRDGLLAVDPESGELHIHHLNCNGLFLAEFAEKQRNTIPTTKETV